MDSIPSYAFWLLANSSGSDSRAHRHHEEEKTCRHAHPDYHHRADDPGAVLARPDAADHLRRILPSVVL